jgi:XrtJ-associated TM-motif-TM protein
VTPYALAGKPYQEYGFETEPLASYSRGSRRKWMIMKKTLLLTALAFALVVAVPAYAQGGCADSPENPTIILAGLTGGAFAVSSLRTRFRARRAAKNK